MYLSHFSSEDGEGPTREQVTQWLRRTRSPENEFPAATGLSALLGQSGEAAVGITQIEAFSTGFQFTLAIRVRQARRELVHGGLYTLISGHPHPNAEISLEDRLLIGVEYANGHRASTLHDMRMGGPGAMTDESLLMLTQQSGSGGELSVDQTYWVCPLPPEGPVTFVSTWPAFGITETRTEIDSAPIRAAAERSRLLWPPQPPMERFEPPPPPRPSTGWFAEPPS
jgi:hypothetical protein